ncbi:1097_t:CDS:2 [Funneliformis caledonium]|uniref:1097_t:CDS:1 n=1 Tax=Funneliformis caledonium TaxID=1117310 RepID=A0A9N9A5G2_9GLOM|nr:1097_t:CDS:2 [Funneliformis caledonium]
MDQVSDQYEGISQEEFEDEENHSEDGVLQQEGVRDQHYTFKERRLGIIDNIAHFGIDIKKLGCFAVIPYAVQGAMGFVVGTIGDHMIHKVRRIAQSINWKSWGRYFPFIGCASSPFEGIILNQFDIAPKYAGIIYGQHFRCDPCIFGVALTGWILDVAGRNWNIRIFVASLYFSSALILVGLGWW